MAGVCFVCLAPFALDVFWFAIVLVSLVFERASRFELGDEYENKTGARRFGQMEGLDARGGEGRSGGFSLSGGGGGGGCCGRLSGGGAQTNSELGADNQVSR